MAQEQPLQFTIRPMASTQEELEHYRSFRARHRSFKELDVLRWQYLENVCEKESLVNFAVKYQPEGSQSVERIASVYATFPVQVLVDGKAYTAVQSVDTLTDEAFRGLGLFKRTARSVYERCAQEGVSFVYGFPNGNSAHGFFHRLGWQCLDPVPFLVRPLRLGYLVRRLGLWAHPLARWLDLPIPHARSARARRRGREVEIAPIASFGPAFDTLWEAFSRGIRVCVRRDHRYLNWRLVQKPHHDYMTLCAREGGELRGFVSFRVVDKHGGRIGYVMELMYPPGEDHVGERLLGRMLSMMKQAGAEIVLAWSFAHAPNHRAFCRALFLPFPERVRPIELHMGVCALAYERPAVLAKREHWYLSYCDSDTV